MTLRALHRRRGRRARRRSAFRARLGRPLAPLARCGPAAPSSMLRGAFRPRRGPAAQKPRRWGLYARGSGARVVPRVLTPSGGSPRRDTAPLVLTPPRPARLTHAERNCRLRKQRLPHPPRPGVPPGAPRDVALRRAARAPPFRIRPQQPLRRRHCSPRCRLSGLRRFPRHRFRRRLCLLGHRY